MYSLRKTINIDKIDIAFIFFLVVLAVYYRYYISLIQSPGWDAVVYLTNARSWLYDVQLLETYRPPLISWLIAGIWLFTGEDWIIIKPLQAIFTIGSGILLYIIIKRHKGHLFAMSVVVLTMLNTQVFFGSLDIITGGISLFFLIVTIYFLKSDKESHWYLAGIALGLTFATRYYIVIQAITVFITEYLITKNRKLFTRVIVGAVPIISLVILIMFLKTGTFEVIYSKDVNIGIMLSSFYLLNSIKIWGPIFLLTILAFISNKTYIDKYNYTFISWLVISLIFWSSMTNHEYELRYTIEYTPAVYYLAMLSIENIYKGDNVLFEIQTFVERLLEKIRLLK